MNIVLIGSGNVAAVLGKTIEKRGHKIIQVVSRTGEHAASLAAVFDCASGKYPGTKLKDADLYIFAIADSGLQELDKQVHLENKLVVHTAGSVSKNVLKPVSHNYGVIYPLQTLNKDSDEVPQMPLLIDGSSPDVLARLNTFALSISDSVEIINDDERLKYHVAAIFVNNFTNHLYALADNFCTYQHIAFKKLLPLVEETTRRLKKNSPLQLQTGPAVRHDVLTLNAHLKLLSYNPDIKNIYLKLSESILKLHDVE